MALHGTLAAARPDLSTAPDAGSALFEWLDAFVVHIAAKRPLALAVTESADQRRTRLFADWHRSITEVATRLLGRAASVGAVRGDLAIADLLALTSAAAIASSDPDHARRLLSLLRSGFQTASP